MQIDLSHVQHQNCLFPVQITFGFLLKLPVINTGTAYVISLRDNSKSATSEMNDDKSFSQVRCSQLHSKSTRLFVIEQPVYQI